MTHLGSSSGSPLLPGDTIGIVGGGQLGQMMALSAKEMGFRVGVLDPTEDCPASQVADWAIVAPYGDAAAIRELARRSDVLTYEFENVSASVLDELGDSVSIPQGTEVLKHSQNRIDEKNFLSGIGVPVAPYRAVDRAGELESAIAQIGFPCVLKTATGGYDGKGQQVIKDQDDLPKAIELAESGPCILEGWVPFAKEVSALVTADGRGEAVVFPIAENEHVNGILHTTTAPARINEEAAKAARSIALKIATSLDTAGTMAIEMFVEQDGRVLVNEMAPRPHNSGHYTIEACSLSQFDAHIRAIAGWPVPEPDLLESAVMVNVLGQHLDGTCALIADHPDWSFHYYGKATPAPGRKMGHITVLTDDADATLEQIEQTGVWNE